MTSVEIIKEEFKAAGLEMAEETAKKFFLVLEGKIIPRLATEATDEKIKALASISGVVIGAMKPIVLAAIDKIDGQVG